MNVSASTIYLVQNCHSMWCHNCKY